MPVLLLLLLMLLLMAPDAGGQVHRRNVIKSAIKHLFGECYESAAVACVTRSISISAQCVRHVYLILRWQERCSEDPIMLGCSSCAVALTGVMCLLSSALRVSSTDTCTTLRGLLSHVKLWWCYVLLSSYRPCSGLVHGTLWHCWSCCAACLAVPGV
jgi:hypothetical protein